MSGTRFETLPPLAILLKLFQFLKSLGLKSVGLELGCVPFHSGWELVEWRPKLAYLEVNSVEILEICDELEEKELEVFGPQIELDLGEGSSIHDLSEPPVEVAREAPTVVEVEDESSVEVIKDETPVEKETSDREVHEAIGIGAEPVHEDVEMETGDMPVHEMEVGDSHFEDYPGEDFEKVGDFTPEETPQIPAEPVPEIPSEETPSSAKPRTKQIKTLTGRTDLPWVRKLIAQRS